jgi:hypothetical protein
MTSGRAPWTPPTLSQSARRVGHPPFVWQKHEHDRLSHRYGQVN